MTGSWQANTGNVLGIGVLVALVVLFLVVIWLALKLRRIERRYLALTAGTDGGNLATVLDSHVEQVRGALQQTGELDALARRLEREGHSHFQRMGFLRFNPFRDAGGDQSFALALADQDGNGVVISSLHSRDGSRVYGKPLAGWESPYVLTDEERVVIQQARSASL